MRASMLLAAVMLTVFAAPSQEDPPSTKVPPKKGSGDAATRLRPRPPITDLSTREDFKSEFAAVKESYATAGPIADTLAKELDELQKIAEAPGIVEIKVLKGFFAELEQMRKILTDAEKRSVSLTTAFRDKFGDWPETKWMPDCQPKYIHPELLPLQVRLLQTVEGGIKAAREGRVAALANDPSRKSWVDRYLQSTRTSGALLEILKEDHGMEVVHHSIKKKMAERFAAGQKMLNAIKKHRKQEE